MKFSIKKLAAVMTAGAMIVSMAAVSFAAETSALNVLGNPSGITQATDGSLLVTDIYNNVIWSIRNGQSGLYAGKNGVLDLYGQPVGGYRDGKNADAFFKEPWDISPFMDGYAVSDTDNNVIRLVRGIGVSAAIGNVTAESVNSALPTDGGYTATLCGSTAAGNANGVGTNAKFNAPTGLATAGDGTLYIADTGNNSIRSLNTKGEVKTYVGGLNAPTGLCYVDGRLYVCESGANRIICIVGGKTEVVAGNGAAGFADGACAQAQFSNPQGVTVANDGAIYVSDTGNKAVRKIKDGQVSTLLAADASAMKLYPQEPRGLYVSGGQLYICDAFSKKLIVISR